VKYYLLNLVSSEHFEHAAGSKTAL